MKCAKHARCTRAYNSRPSRHPPHVSDHRKQEEIAMYGCVQGMTETREMYDPHHIQARRDQITTALDHPQRYPQQL
jgi:hypothetical protein